MRTLKGAHKDKGTPILLPNTKRIWIACFVLGVVFWIIGLILWAQRGIDEAVLAGVGMAWIGLPLSMMFANMVLRKMKQEQLPKLSYVWGFLLIFLTWVFMAL